MSVEWSEGGAIKGKEVSEGPPAAPSPGSSDALSDHSEGAISAPRGQAAFACCPRKPRRGPYLWKPEVCEACPGPSQPGRPAAALPMSNAFSTLLQLIQFCACFSVMHS